MTTNKFITISVAKDFSETPGARHRTNGPYSGQEFYEDIFEPKFREVWDKRGYKILLDIDDTFSYPPSFMSEVFTRLVKEFIDRRKIRSKIIIKSENEPLFVNNIMRIIDEAETE